MFGLFKRKMPWEVQYARNIYDGLVAHNEFGDVTALSLKIPTALHHAYQNKILMQREMLCFAAIMSVASPGTGLPPVMLAFCDIVLGKMAERGLQLSKDQLADTSLQDAELLLTDPGRWAKDWLSEFRSNPDDNHMVVMFAYHCTKLFHAYKNGIAETEHKRNS